ncbi:MAG: YCF48-related protein [Carboxylicivirga sp.]|jgi:photosystem II stability/assembly factor-like uncharacterized protein|nr:YCF48-related protein [Carboxylicivirga sp.]
MKNKYIILTLVMVLQFGGVIAQDWELLNSGTEFHLYQITFPPNQKMIGYAAGSEYHNPSDGIILKTTDGGDTWNKIYPKQGYVDNILCIWFVNENEGYAGGMPNKLLKTTDGGDTWNEVTNLPSNSNTAVLDVKFYNEDKGIVQAVREGGGDFYVTKDGGASWSLTAEFSSAGQPSDIAYIDENTLRLVTPNGNVWQSYDGGINWKELTWLPVGTYSLDFSSTKFVVGSYGLVWFFDIDEPWDESNLVGKAFGGGLGYWNDILTLDDGRTYAVGRSEHIFGTEDGGKHWGDQLFVADDGKTLNCIEYASEGTIFVCGDGGRIYRKRGVTTSIDKKKAQLVNRIYPVPAGNELNIDFIEGDDKEIVIYDQLGAVRMRHSSVQETSIKLDITTLSSGYYIVSIHTKKHIENLSFIKQ